jgi:hypothetical protein
VGVGGGGLGDGLGRGTHTVMRPEPAGRAAAVSGGRGLHGRLARALFAQRTKPLPAPLPLAHTHTPQARFLKVDIDNEQLQRTVMDHGITGVVRGAGRGGGWRGGGRDCGRRGTPRGGGRGVAAGPARSPALRSAQHTSPPPANPAPHPPHARSPRLRFTRARSGLSRSRGRASTCSRRRWRSWAAEGKPARSRPAAAARPLWGPFRSDDGERCARKCFPGCATRRAPG